MSLYPTPQNVTSFEAAVQYSREIVQTAVGYDIFGAMLLLSIFFGSYAFASRFAQQRAALFATLMTFFVGFVLASASLISMDLFALSLIAFLVALLFSFKLSE